MKLNDHIFNLGIALQCVDTHFSAVAALLVTSKGSISIENVVAVYPYGASFQFSSNLMSLINITSPYAGRQPVISVIATRNNLV